MDYDFTMHKEASLDQTMLKVLSTLQRSIEEALARLSRIEQSLEKIRTK